MHVTYTIIGAGVVGLSIARTIAAKLTRGENLVVVEKEDSFGRGISGRNSEVIHSGIYYPCGSLKHRLCVRGRKLLYDYCLERSVAYSKCGKLIVATDETEIDELNALYEKAQTNGVENIDFLDRKEALKLEPDINVVQALFSKETGIVDTHGLMKALTAEISDNEGMLVYRAEVRTIERKRDNYSVGLRDGTLFSTDCLINAAGLGAERISLAAGIPPQKVYPCKGNYFSYRGPHTLSHLVYPVPNKGLKGLGVHATIDLADRLRFGPDIEYVASIDDFAVDEKKKGAFYAAAMKILKNIDHEKLQPESAGIRPKLQGPDDTTFKDFYIEDESGKGFPRFINLLGIESPGLTSAPAIGEYVGEIIGK